ncbi:N-6 DNA methylase [Herpetosiphon gulosus]|uniref:site-specific DNA-methyltransferase (adenine-specific) n=1 Tax=Herpetosiphon gulosus TaxID=1973496 RepID=A0ABP9WYR2_9CHLR
MTQTFASNDVQLTASDIRQLQNADALAGFLARLQYAIDLRTTIDSYAQVGLDSAYLRQEIKHVELLASDPHDQEIKIYLLEVRSLTAALRNAIARAFRDRPELALVILTKDYETLEFVILLRELAQNTQRGAAIRQMLRPVPLTINRLNVSDVALRVLKRFTMTEPDALYQWDKLRSAFVLAEWSEQYFNNRALFSDYYLTQRLTDAKLNAEWNEDVLPIGRKINPLLKTARKQLTDQPLATMQKQFYAPILADLGFVAQPVAGEPAYRYDLVVPNNPQPVAAFFGYVWNRNLDDQDSQRDSATPTIIPGAEVVSTLEAGTVPWVIVSNGKYWRLYSTTASNKATNYYEVDLEEAFGAQDAVVALKYWWLFFRAQAFGGFLERLLKQSAEYAKGLGERLKDRVFTEIFPQFAQGFIADMRRQGANDVSEQQLNTVFEATLTFLYRLMFVLYAESLDLLPLNEHNGYRERSLYTLKREIAKIAGSLLDQRSAKLQAHYSDTSTALYQRILDLCAVIDRGSPDLNMPTYNGGLFSATSVSGQFLQTYAVPDRYLALGLDRLARDLDDRSQALVLIDFKSLGVRQLGSIYEGLLEFKLHIASERLAVTKEKGKEVYQPAAKVAKPLALIEQGMAYLVNDKKERKATGSYYTPDYIVKYIVQQTVGAVLDEKFKALAPRLHEAQKQYRNYANLVAARAKSSKRPENPAVFWTDPNSAMGQLLDDCLNLRVLDPAMGSGHFLVEVVDFISNRLIHFLNAWSENPVWAMIDRTRSEIVADMERQGVTIDPERLTRVALLKRAVLKRCIYGVDLNAMAVELAKVSLWLDAFTLGAPLSFLDHHLKHGNSLIGARVAEVQTYLDVGGSQSHMLAGNEFAGLSLATDLMRQVSFLSDNTVEQAQQSAVAFRDADQHLAPFKRMLDVYTSRWFGNQPAKKSKSDWVNIFLRMPSIKPWLHDATAKLDDSLIPASQIGQIALEAASSKHFFHWELEFPEIFFAPSRPGGQDVQLNPNGGFDAVVGNPPWGAKIDDPIKHYLRILYGVSSISEFTKKPVLEGEINVYTLFMMLSLENCSNKGKIGMITPEGWTVNKSEQYFRKFLLDNIHIINICILRKNVFSAAPDIIPVISIVEKKNEIKNTLVNVYGFNRPIKLLNKLEWKDSKHIMQSDWYNEPYFVFTLCQSSELLDLYQRIKETSLKMGSLSTINISDGIYKSLIIDDIISNEERPILISADEMKRYSIESNNNFISFVRYNDIPLQERIKYDLDKLFFHAMKKPSVEYRVVCYWDNSIKGDYLYRYVLTNNFVVLTAKELGLSLGYISAICNSKFINHWYSERYIQVNIEAFTLGEIPIFYIEFTTGKSERERLTQIAIDLYTQKNDNNVLTFVNTLFTVENPIQSNPIQSNPIQSNPIQSNPIQSNPIQSNPIQSNPLWRCRPRFISLPRPTNDRPQQSQATSNQALFGLARKSTAHPTQKRRNWPRQPFR